MALNKVNIEFLRKQMDKVLVDIEKLKDSNRELNTQTVTDNDRKAVVGLLMFIMERLKNTEYKNQWLSNVYAISAKLRDVIQ